jgi:hypothetical protein
MEWLNVAEGFSPPNQENPYFPTGESGLPYADMIGGFLKEVSGKVSSQRTNLAEGGAVVVVQFIGLSARSILRQAPFGSEPSFDVPPLAGDEVQGRRQDGELVEP